MPLLQRAASALLHPLARPAVVGHLAPKARGARARKHEQMKKGGGTASAGKPTDSFSYNVFQVSLLLRYACARRESLT